MSAPQDEQPATTESGASDPTRTEPPADGAATDPWAPHDTEPPADRQTVDTPRKGARSGVQRTRISGTWVAVIVAALVLLMLLIFILQNLDPVTVHLLGGAPSLPLGVALLLSAIGGALLVALIGGARISQLRRAAKRRGKR